MPTGVKCVDDDDDDDDDDDYCDCFSDAMQ